MLVFLAFLIFSPLCFLLLVILCLYLFRLITNPKLDTNWIDLHKNLPAIDLRDDTQIFIKNIADARYNPEFEFEYKLTYLNKRYNLKDLQKVWFFENNYAPLQSHIMITFEFLGGIFLSVSPEVRKSSLEDFQIWHVLTKKYSIFYRFALEQDVIYLRTNIRNSPTTMYELNLSQKQIQDLFLSICASANQIHKKDLIYVLFKTDCVNTLLANFRNANIEIKKYFWDWSPTKVLQRSNLVKKPIILLNDKTTNLQPDEFFSIAIRKSL